MRAIATLALVIFSSVFATCAKRVPKVGGAPPGTPRVSWIVMSGDRDNADQDFVCQSDRADECVVPASRADRQVFSDVHFYYHAAGSETKYTGSIQIEFFEGTPAAQRVAVDVTVTQDEAIYNQSVRNIVSARPGRYAIAFNLTARSNATGRTQSLREEVPVTVK